MPRESGTIDAVLHTEHGPVRLVIPHVDALAKRPALTTWRDVVAAIDDVVADRYGPDGVQVCRAWVCDHLGDAAARDRSLARAGLRPGPDWQTGLQAPNHRQAVDALERLRHQPDPSQPGDLALRVLIDAWTLIQAHDVPLPA